MNKPGFKLSLIYLYSLLIFCCACHHQHNPTAFELEHITHLETGNTTPGQLVNFACSLAGTPYTPGGVDPVKGFDCSGFVTYVFNHFNIIVPRTSADFADVQREIPLQQAKAGDLIMFTGSDSTNHIAGHMGIISSTPGEPLRFMHAASGKKEGVEERDFNTPYYKARFIKVIRVFESNGRPGSDYSA